MQLNDDLSRETQQWVGRIASGWPHWNAVRHINNSADPWVIAYARAMGGVVVSEERRRATGGGGVKIPDVCDGLGVTHFDLLELFRTEGFRETP